MLSPDQRDRVIQKREKNKVAAEKCRVKRRERNQEIRAQYEDYLEANEELESQIRKLREEHRILQELLENHSCVMQKTCKTWLFSAISIFIYLCIFFLLFCASYLPISKICFIIQSYFLVYLFLALECEYRKRDDVTLAIWHGDYVNWRLSGIRVNASTHVLSSYPGKLSFTMTSLVPQCRLVKLSGARGIPTRFWLIPLKQSRPVFTYAK